MQLFKPAVVGVLVGVTLSGSALARTDLPNFHALADLSAPAAYAAPASFAAAKQGHALKTNPVASAQRALTQRAMTQHLIAGPEALRFNERLGVPSFVWANPALPKFSMLAAKPQLQTRLAADSYFRKYAPLYGFNNQNLSGTSLKSVHDTGSGVIIAQYTQTLQGIEVFGQQLNIAMQRDMSLVALSGSLRASAGAQSNTSTSALSASSDFTLSAQDAILAAFKDMGGQDVLLEPLERKGAYERYRSADRSADYVLDGAARAKKIWFTLRDGLEPAYYVEVSGRRKGKAGSDHYGYAISARSGALLFRNNQTAHEAFDYRVYADSEGNNLPWDGPQGRYGHPSLTGSISNNTPPAAELFKPANLVTLAHGPIARGDAWLTSGATETRGNNVDAYADIKEPDGFSEGDFRAGTSTYNRFDYSHNPITNSDDRQGEGKAGVVQLFYLTNWLHDWFYDAGFDEKSGNAQVSNYGRGGVEGDPLLAEAQDYSGLDNANMTTPADGTSPRMQMYYFAHEGAGGVTGGDEYIASGSAWFGLETYRLSAELARYQDAQGDDNACTPAANAEALRGKIALFQSTGFFGEERCRYVDMAKNAQAAGASGVLIYSTEPNVSLAFAAPWFEQAGVTIPVRSLGGEQANHLFDRMRTAPVALTLWQEPSAYRDAALDGMIVAHEWGHFISNRLIGDGSGLSNNQGRAMGEGWGDFHALLLTVEKADLDIASNARYSGAYAVGGYSTLSPIPGWSDNKAFYTGIRRVPYSTDRRKNALSFKHIERGVPLPEMEYVAFDKEGAGNSRVHNAGEVWATMLWECYTGLLNDHRYSFEQAQERMKRYLVAGYKLTPHSPTYVEARDALLAAVLASDKQDHRLFVQAFATRGLGAGAVAPDRFDNEHRGVIESFDTGGGVLTEQIHLNTRYSRVEGTNSVALFQDEDDALDAGETALLTLKVRNPGFETLKGLTAQLSAKADVSFSGDGVLRFPDVAPGTSAELAVEVTLHSATSTGERLAIEIAYSAQAMTAKRDTYQTRINYDRETGLTKDQFNNLGLTDWRSKELRGGYEQTISTGSGFVLTQGILPERAPDDYQYFAPDLNDVADRVLESPEFVVGEDDKLIVRWLQAYSFAMHDSGPTTAYMNGGIVEYKTADSSYWYPVTDRLSPSTLHRISWWDNPLYDQSALAGKSEGFPALQPISLDLSGLSLAGKAIRIRFRLGSLTIYSAGALGEGWFIDDVEVSGLSNKPFSRVIADKQSLAPRHTRADAGPDQSLPAGQWVTLSSAASTIATGATAQHVWSQLSGPLQTLSVANNGRTRQFLAPSSGGDFEFKLVLTDSLGVVSEDTVSVHVQSQMEPPVETPPVTTPPVTTPPVTTPPVTTPPVTTPPVTTPPVTTPPVTTPPVTTPPVTTPPVTTPPVTTPPVTTPPVTPPPVTTPPVTTPPVTTPPVTTPPVTTPPVTTPPVTTPPGNPEQGGGKGGGGALATLLLLMLPLSLRRRQKGGNTLVLVS